MKVNTLTVWDMSGDELVEIHNESHEYTGPVAEAKGGGGSSNTTSTTVQKADPWEGIQPNIKDIVGRAESLSNQARTFYPGPTYVERDPWEDLGAQSAMTYGTTMLPSQIGDVMATNRFMLGAPDVANNPYVGAQADVIQDRLSRQFNEQLLPGIQEGAIKAGQLGGTRQGVAEGIAARGVSEAAGQALANLYGDAYETGLKSQISGMAFAPQTMNLGFMPSQAMSQYGGYQRGEREMALAEDMARHDFQQQEPWDRLGMYNTFVQGLPWSTSSTSTGNFPGQSYSGLGNALGGGMLGYGLMTGTGMLGGMLPAGGLGGMAGLGAAAGPIGLLGGALLGSWL